MDLAGLKAKAEAWDTSMSVFDYVAAIPPPTVLALIAAAEVLEDIMDTGFCGGPQGKRALKALAALKALETANG